MRSTTALEELDEAFSRRLEGRRLSTALGLRSLETVIKMTERKGVDPRNGDPWSLWNVSVKPLGESDLEDVTYHRYPLLRTCVHRVCVVERNAGGEMEFVVEGLPKFEAFSAHVDEDDTAEDDAGAAAASEPDFGHGARSVFAWEKINGHMWVAHARRDAHGVPWVYAGTKNCIHKHLLHMDLNSDLCPTTMVADVFKGLQAKYRLYGEELLEALLAEVVVGEIQTNQHLVFHDPPGDMIAFNTSPATDRLFRKPGVQGPFSVAHMRSAATLARFRSGYNTEGLMLVTTAALVAVALLTDKVLLRLKFKSVWYIIVRALRQLWQDAWTALQGKQKMLHRILQHNLYMLVDIAFLMRVFEQYLCPLIEYMVAHKVQRRVIAFNGTGFAHVLEAFRVSKGWTYEWLNGLFQVPEAACSVEEARAALAGAASASAAASCLVVASACMGPGVGKTRVMKEVRRCLETEFKSYSVCDMSQDQFSPSADFYPALADAMKRVDVVVLHRCNFSERDRAGVVRVVNKAGGRLLFVQPREDPRGLDMLFASLRGALSEAPDRAVHPSLGSDKPASLKLRVASAFWVGMERVGPAEVAATVCVPVLVPGATLPPELTKALQTFGADMQRRNRNFALQHLPDMPALVGLIQGGPELRRPVDDIVRDVVAAVKDFAGRGGVDAAGAAASAAGGGSAGAADAVDSADAAGASCASGASAAGGGSAGADAAVAGRVEYVGLFFKEPLAEFLVGKPDKGVSISADHVTVKFRPNAADLETLQTCLGRSFEVHITTVHKAIDGSIAALGVEVPDAQLAAHLGATGHITLWHSKLRKPVFARELVALDCPIEKEVTVLSEVRTVMARLDFAYDKSRRSRR